MKTRFGLFSFLTVDHKGLQEYLNQMAAEGWRLDKVLLGLLARFVPTQRRDLTYFADWTDARNGEDPAYLALCADAGWELVHSGRYISVFASRPGEAPVPIQTDGELEYRRFLKKVLKNMVIGAIPTLLQLFLLIFQYASSGGENLLQILTLGNYSSFVFLTFPFLSVMGLLYIGILGARLVTWRRSLPSGGPLPAPDPRWARLRRFLPLALHLWSVLFFLLLLLDVAVSLLYAVLLGFTFGIILVVCALDPKVRRQGRVGLASLAVLFFLTVGVGGAGRLFNLSGGDLYQMPVEAPIYRGHEVFVISDSACLLGGQTRWYEELPEPSGDDAPADSFSVELYSFRLPALTELAAGLLLRPEMTVSGPGVWSYTGRKSSWGEYSEDHTSMVILLGGAVALVEGVTSELPENIVETILLRLSGGEARA